MIDEAGYQPLDPPAWIVQGLGPAGKAHLAVGYGIAGTEAFIACGRVLYEPHQAEEYENRCLACVRSQTRGTAPDPSPAPQPRPSSRRPPAPRRGPPHWVTRAQAKAALAAAEREARADQMAPATVVADLKRCVELLPRIALMAEMAAHNIEHGDAEQARGELDQAASLLRRRLEEVEAARTHLRTVNGIITAARRS